MCARVIILFILKLLCIISFPIRKSEIFISISSRYPAFFQVPVACTEGYSYLDSKDGPCAIPIWQYLRRLHLRPLLLLNTQVQMAFLSTVNPQPDIHATLGLQCLCCFPNVPVRLLCWLALIVIAMMGCKSPWKQTCGRV